MIEAKGTKEAAVNPTAARDRYVLKSGDQRLSIPIAFGALLVGIASYLKSVVPVEAATQPGQEPSNTPPPNEEALPDGAGELHAAEDLQIVPHEAFEFVDSPAFDYADIGASSVVSSTTGKVLSFRPRLTIDNQAPLPEPAAVVQFPSSKALPSSVDAGGVSLSSDISGSPSAEAPSRNAQAEKEDRNRAPRITGPTRLNDVLGSTAVLISVSDLLRNATDPDGDRLHIRNLTASSGTLTPVAEGWLYKPEAGLGDVVLDFEVTDGEFVVDHLARFAVVRTPAIAGTAGDDNLIGTAAPDDIDGRDGNNNIDGRGGSDIITTGSGNDHVVGGSGDDIIIAGAGDDLVFAGDGNDTVHGGGGNDRIFGESGNDLLFGEAGNDVIDGGDGADTLSDGHGKDTVRGGIGKDHVIVAMDQDDDAFDGGSEEDTLDISEATKTVVVDLESNDASGEEIGANVVTNFERVIAGSGDDCLTGSAADETLLGGAGDDVLCGEGGEDNLQGGAGDDQLVASLDAENDHYDGGEGADTLDLSFATMRLEIDLTQDKASGLEIGLDTIRNFEEVVGGQGDDLFIVSEKSTIVKGGGGNDTFVFSATIASTDMQDSIHEILDFMVGDNIRIKEFELFQGESAPEQFEQHYGEDNRDGEGPIRVRHDRLADLERTFVEADMNSDDQYEISITLYGNFSLSLNVHDA